MSMDSVEFEATAREISEVGLLRYGGDLLDQVPQEKRELLIEVLTSIAHDAIEFGECLPDDHELESHLEQYALGYREGYEDAKRSDNGDKEK